MSLPTLSTIRPMCSVASPPHTAAVSTAMPSSSVLPPSPLHVPGLRAITVPAAVKEAADQGSVAMADGELAHKQKTIAQLLRGIAVFELCRVQPLVVHSSRLLEFMDDVTHPSLTNVLLKATFFGHFCGGETRQEVQSTIQTLAAHNVGTILDYAAEADVEEDNEDVEVRELGVDSHKLQARTFTYMGEETCDENLENTLECIEAARGGNGFAAVKLTSLGRPELLQYVSHVLIETQAAFEEAVKTARESGDESDGLSFDSFKAMVQKTTLGLDDSTVEDLFRKIDTDRDNVISYLEWHSFLTPLQLSRASVEDLQTIKMLTPNSETKLNKAGIQAFQNLLGRMEAAAAAAQDAGVNLLVDAEQTYLQPAIDHCVLHAMREFNQERATVYNTYQSYLKSCRSRLLTDMHRAQREGFKFGAKVVRGAYMVQEAKRAEDMGYESPIHETIDDTHEAYDANIDTLLRNLDTCRVMVASHNRNSVAKAILTMAELGIDPSDRRVAFGQLLGMCDYITMPLGEAGYNVVKCVPYGPVRLVIPYLQRRAIENSDVLGGSAVDRANLWEALRGRLSPRSSAS